jgi:4-amino-4-deoxy-L-arabinose transferase-like glycosyltransferase
MLKKAHFIGIALAALVVYICGLFITIMDVDSAQYASISQDMADTGSYLEVKHFGKDYLDKPPLMFWVTAVFFQLFGYANWVFKLGSFLFSVLGILSTYKIGKYLYNKQVGLLAAMLLLSSQAMFLINNDVRTDTMLIGAATFSIWQLLGWLTHKKWSYLFGAALGIALAMLAKGPIGLMVPVIAIGSYLAGKGRWKAIFMWQYLVLIALVGVLLSPMLYGLYTQFDAQPEKEITFLSENGNSVETGVSGIKFYFWTQSFGRITGENVWRDNSGPFFFVHNFLWSFLPWSLLFVVAFGKRMWEVANHALKGVKLPELLTPLGFLIPFLVLSTSSYKLPHYIFILFPLASILLAQWLNGFMESGNQKGFKAILFTQGFIALISVVFLGFIYGYVFTDFSVFTMLFLLLLLGAGVRWILGSKGQIVRVLIGSACISIAVNFTMNTQFYPKLMQYQAGNQIASFVQEEELNLQQLYRYDYFSFSLMYYLHHFVEFNGDQGIEAKLDQGEPVYMLCYQEGFNDLNQHFEIAVVKKFGTFRVTQLSFEFLNPQTREKALDPVYLVKILESKS